MKYEPNSQQRATLAHFVVVPMLIMGSAACAEPPVSSKRAPLIHASQPGPVSNLPFAQGRAFATLDEYLKFRESRGGYDVPWYRQIRPGVYELVSKRAPGAAPRTYSREELARKFGFAE